MAEQAAHRFRSYGEAVGGSRRARWGLRQILDATVENLPKGRTLERYRTYLVCEPGETRPGRPRATGPCELTCPYFSLENGR